MSVYVDTGGFPYTVESDLMVLCAADSGLGDTGILPGSNPPIITITYVETTSGAGQSLLNTAVNICGTAIVVTGVNSSFLIDGNPISNYAGITYRDGIVLRIVYDVTQCGGSYYYVFDTAGKKISFANSILLGHEMAHAVNACAGAPIDDEVEAENVENTLRTQQGMQLRDPHNHDGGCGYTGPEPASGCFIVTAASGTSSSRLVAYAIRLRDLFVRRSRFGQLLFDNVWDDYYQFSPGFARTLSNDQVLRQEVLHLVVIPLLQFYSLLEPYLLGVSGLHDLERELTARFTSVGSMAADAQNGQRYRTSEVVSAVEVVAALGKAPPHGERQLGETSPLEGFPALRSLAAVLSMHRTSEYTDWALLKPLSLAWSHVNGVHEHGSAWISDRFTSDVENWLGSVPIPPKFLRLNLTDIARDLTLIRDSILRRDSARHRFGARLLDRLGVDVTPAMRDLLSALDYLPVHEGMP